MPETNAFKPDQKYGGGRYTLIKLLGQGGMGVVWLARDEKLREEVALKFLPPQIQADKDALDDLRRETARSHRLSHQNIIRIHDFHEFPEEPAFISMEYIAGSTLDDLRRQQPQRVLTWQVLKPLVGQLCDALGYAHSVKIIHRDLKPANLMVDASERLKLADFGVAAVVGNSLSRESARRLTSGTVTHMSPQQMNGQMPQITDDIYALGASLYHLLTSKPPFFQGDIHYQVQNEMPAPLEKRLLEFGLQNDVPSPVAATILACLNKEPDQRPQSAQAVMELMNREVVEQKVNVDNPELLSRQEGLAVEAQQQTTGVSWSRLILRVTGVLAILLIAGLAWVHYSNKSASPLKDASRGQRDSIPTNMALIPAGSFEMGDAWDVGLPAERPVHKVHVSAFYMDKYEVTKELWVPVRDYGVTYGFQFDNVGVASGTGHPVHSISWYDAVKWCNARSLKEGLTPVYCTDANQTNFYKTGQIDLLNTFVKWSANGYRLPTEAEWEKAGRGGLARHQYPWQSSGTNFASFIDNTKARYGQSSGTGPVGNYAANGYGLYDMAGNVWEWCWDWHDDSWYGNAGAILNDTRGPIGSMSNRELRGSSWLADAYNMRCAIRGVASPTYANNSVGFRCVRGLAAGNATNRTIAKDSTGDPSGNNQSKTSVLPAVTNRTAVQRTSISTNMALIPDGAFEMGDAWNVGRPEERPVHKVYVSAFYMDKSEVTKELWDEVRDYGVANGFQFDKNGRSFGTGHPVHSISWYDAVKWCNARSLKEALTPVYCTDASQTRTYNSGQVDLSDTFVKWGANGYRLPTDAEWEKAARGGLARHQYPWPSFGTNDVRLIDNTKARYGQSWQGSGTAPVVNYAANGYGLYDMSGNVVEWCWDWYDAAWYGNAGATLNDTHGPPGPLSLRVVRGGSWGDTTYYLRCAFRGGVPPSRAATTLNHGFRCVRGL